MSVFIFIGVSVQCHTERETGETAINGGSGKVFGDLRFPLELSIEERLATNRHKTITARAEESQSLRESRDHFSRRSRVNAASIILSATLNQIHYYPKNRIHTPATSLISYICVKREEK